MINWTRTIVCGVAAAVAVPFAAPVVHAQSQVIEEIVVTARKRAESLEDIPVSATAFTADEIESAGITTPQDFIDLTPNVTLVQTQNAGNAFINIRGVSQARNSEMSAAVLLDGVLMANPAQFNQQLFDIEQIEVLRGPQGALYGRNAIGGAITIVTRQPSDELEGQIQLSGDSGPGWGAKGAISGPVGDSDTLKFRASAAYMDTDGFIKNRYLNEEADPYKDFSARLTLLWQPTDRFSADLRFSMSQLDTQALYFVIDADADDTDLPVRVNNRGTNERDMYTVSLKLDFETDFGTFTSITAYDDLQELLTGDQFNFVPPEESLINFFPIARSSGISPATRSPISARPSISRRTPGARRSASPPRPRTPCAGSPAPTSSAPTVTSPPATRSTAATACSTSRRRRGCRCSSTPPTRARS
jgi:iron complex outermembrane recepter protein